MFDTKNIQSKLKNLPEPEKSLATSLKAAEINIEIFNNLRVEPAKWADLTLLIASVIIKDVFVNELKDKIVSILDIDEERALNLSLELTGYRLLAFDDWLDGEVVKYLQENGVDPSRYVSSASEQQLAISKEAEFFKEQLKEDEEYVFEANETPAQAEKKGEFEDILEKEDEDNYSDLAQNFNLLEEKKLALQALKKGLIDVLKSKDDEVLDKFNYSFVAIWTQDEKFSEEVMPALLANREKISDSKIKIAEEEKPATISNFIKEFIKKYGLLANDLNIAEFLSSKVAGNFSDREKVLALRILKFYNNINNLNSYLEGDLEGVTSTFEVLPPPASRFKNNASKSGNQNVNIQDRKPISKSADTDNRKEEVIIDKDGADKLLKPEKSNFLNELEVMLQDYDKSSLEYKTILQEINRIKSGKK